MMTTVCYLYLQDEGLLKLSTTPMAGEDTIATKPMAGEGTIATTPPAGEDIIK
jgi:hypothetical protein